MEVAAHKWEAPPFYMEKSGTPGLVISTGGKRNIDAGVKNR